MQQAADAEADPHCLERRQLDEIEAKAAVLIRQRFFEADTTADNAYQSLDTTQGFGAEANGRILAILGQAPTEPTAIGAFQRLAYTLVAWWDADDDQQQDWQERHVERNHEMESVLSDLLQNFLLRTSEAAATTILQPILDAVDCHPREVHWLILGLISVEARQPNTPQFWSLWKLFAESVRRARWLAEIDDEPAHGDEMISAIFLGESWKEVSYRRSLTGYAHLVHLLFEDLPASSTILDHYVRFLHHIGEQSLPEEFVRVAKRLQQADPQRMLRKGNTVFLLEILLQRYVYGSPSELKRQSDLRNAILMLLDILVENGSSAAFRMRDDFVTPMSTQLSVSQGKRGSTSNC